MKKLSRRALLRGIGGAAVALPILECMLGRHGEKLATANAPGLPQRYALLFAGQALGGDNYEKTSSRIAGENIQEEGHFIAPAAVGQGYGVTTPLVPLEERGLLGDVSVVTNMAIPFNATNGDASAVPAGGAYRDFHGGGCSPLLSGTRSTSAGFTCNGPTSDQVIAEMCAGDTIHRHLIMRAQVPFYLTGYDHSGRQYISYAGSGSGGRIEAQTSPRNAYMALFGSFVPPDDEEAQAVLDFQLRSRRSVLDLVTGSRQKLTQNVSSYDKQRLERHFDEIRDLEIRLGAEPPLVGGECQKLADPGPDPSIGGDNTGAGSDDITSASTGYSDEHVRARTMCDLMHMAFVCDLTRVSTLQITAFQSHMSALPPSQQQGYEFHADVHELGHNGDVNNRGQKAVSIMLQWHISHYAYLLEKLKNTPEGNGSMLDNCAAVFTAEAGHGRQLNDATSENQTHSVENMAMLVGGRAGGLTPGSHIRTDRAHPAQCLTSAMRAVGYPGDSLGEVSGILPELFES